MLRDTQAAINEMKSVGPVGIVGFCMGGTIAFLAATRLVGAKAAVCYYGGKIVAFADEKPRCPTQMHFGELDQSIPMTDVETIKGKRPDCEIYVYPDAGHGFHCDERGSYHAPSAAQAWERTTAFLGKNLALTPSLQAGWSSAYRAANQQTVVILGLVPRIHLSANAGASRRMDGRDKPDHDNGGVGSRVQPGSEPAAAPAAHP